MTLCKSEKIELLQAYGEFGSDLIGKGADFARFRKALKFTQKQMASACHVCVGTVTKYEQGNSVSPSIAMLLWCVLMGIALADKDDALFTAMLSACL